MSFGDGGQTILVAENDRTVLELIQIRLTVAGYGVSTARTGALALETLLGCRPAAIIIDRDLPEISGFEVLKALKQRGEQVTCPVLLLTRSPSREDIQQAQQLGVRGILIKPFSGADVVERVTRLLRPAKAELKVA